MPGAGAFALLGAMKRALPPVALAPSLRGGVDTAGWSSHPGSALAVQLSAAGPGIAMTVAALFAVLHPATRHGCGVGV